MLKILFSLITGAGIKYGQDHDSNKNIICFRYRENVKRGSAIMNDRPVPPLDAAMYWIEYVLRHKGAPHLRSAAQDLAWHELYLLDVLGFIFIVSTLVIYASYCVTKFFATKLFCKKKAKTSKQKKEN